MKFKKDEEGKLVLDDKGDPIAVSESGEVIPLDKVVSVGKFERVETERDEYKGQVEKLNGQITELSKVSGDKEALEKQLTEIKAGAETTRTELEARMAARDKEYALDTALLKAGCRDTKAARAHIDLEKIAVDGETLTGFDPEAFKKDKSYLFEASTSVSTAASSSGGANGGEDAQMRAVMGLKPEE